MKLFFKNIILGFFIFFIMFNCNASRLNSLQSVEEDVYVDDFTKISTMLSVVSSAANPIDSDLLDLVKEYSHEGNVSSFRVREIGNKVYDFLDSIDEGLNKYLAFWNIAVEINNDKLNPSALSAELRKNLKPYIETYFVSEDGHLKTRDEFSRVFINRKTGDVGIWWTDEEYDQLIYMFRLINSGKMSKEDFEECGMKNYSKTMDEFTIDLILK